jgi:hypothetical protein
MALMVVSLRQLKLEVLLEPGRTGSHRRGLPPGRHLVADDQRLWLVQRGLVAHRRKELTGFAQRSFRLGLAECRQTAALAQLELG